MRPVPDVPAFPRKPADPLPSSCTPLDPRTAAPATFFLSRSPHASDPERSPSPDASEDPKESMYGIHSLAETLSRSELGGGSTRGGYPADSLNQRTRSSSRGSDNMKEISCSRRRSTIRLFDCGDTRDSSLQPPASGTVSRPLTPFHPDEPSSLPSSPKSISNQSLRPLDDISITDEINSQAIGSGDEEEGPRPSPRLGFAGASQFIMPSIKMPSRRPFTERGKAMGRFKVLVAGAPGSGKTSLIKAIVQTCEDIVHVDSIDSLPSVTALERQRRRSSRPHSGPVPTRGMPTATSEIYASTKPYPSWWSDLEDSRVLRRRKSIGEIVLERNLCFVDTSATSLSRAGQTDSVVQYMRQQWQRATTAAAGSGVDFQNLLAGNGGTQVDAILYLVSHDTLTTDLECIRKLCDLSNVIPLVAKADTLSPENITALKDRFHQQAQHLGFKPFMFGDSAGLDDQAPQPPYAVSSEKTTDLEVMDASTLMSPDYEQPLVPSELDTLVQKLFDRDNLAWLRHSAAKKLVQRCADLRTGPTPAVPASHALSGATSPGVGWPGASGASLSSSISSLGESPPTYTLARLADYTRHEERMAQVRLAQWATDLQRSLQNERERYAALARGDRAIWLTERLSECVVDGSLVPISQTPGFCGLHAPTTDKASGGLNMMRACAANGKEYRVAALSPHDPLGVVGWIDDIGRRGWIIVQIVGSVGVVGGLALWVARSWGLSSQNLSDFPLDHWYGSLER